MAKNVANNISHYVRIAAAQEDSLGRIRHWSEVQIGFEADMIWLKGLSAEQVESVAIKTLPLAQAYEEREGRLFPYGSKLPERVVPTLLWTSISRGLALSLPKLNFNYFGLEEKINIRLQKTEEMQEAVALRIDLEALSAYVSTASAVRLGAIRWTILGETEALLIGQPLLPLPGRAYWQKHSFLIPLGYDLEPKLLSDTLQEAIGRGQDHWICWQPDATYSFAAKADFVPLSIASFRLTIDQLRRV